MTRNVDEGKRNKYELDLVDKNGEVEARNKTGIRERRFEAGREEPDREDVDDVNKMRLMTGVLRRWLWIDCVSACLPSSPSSQHSPFSSQHLRSTHSDLDLHTLVLLVYLTLLRSVESLSVGPSISVLFVCCL